jgi:uncharacterized protein (UPF0276 family)
VTPRGVGLGLRWELLEELEERASELDFVEVCPENYMRRGGAVPAALERVRARLPVLTHGLTMSLGGTDPLDQAYLEELARFLRNVGAPWHSDHLCFGEAGGRVLHDLLPLAFTERTARRVADRVRRAEDALGVPMAVENISYYWHPGAAEMDEAQFLSRVCELANCALLLDVNNAWVNAVNRANEAGASDPRGIVDAWMRSAPLERTVQIHVAGHEWWDERDLDPYAPEGARVAVDTHGAPIADPVLELLERVLPRTGPVPVLLERDTNVPPLSVLLAEVDVLRAIWQRVHGASAQSPGAPLPSTTPRAP